MNSRNSPFFLHLLAFLLVIFSATQSLVAQESQLVLVHYETNQVIHLQKGFRVFLRLQGEMKETRGKLEAVTDTALTVNGEQIPVDQILAINGVHWTNTAAQIGSAGVLTVGALWFLLGAGLATEGLSEGESIRLFGGYYLDMRIGAALFYVGLRPWIKRKKRYWLGQGWQLAILHPPQ